MKKLIFTIIVVFTTITNYAQERTISGVVSDDIGPISDITVMVKGTSKGTVTDFDGHYSIKAKTGDVLTFSHISYNTEEKIVEQSNQIDIGINEISSTVVLCTFSHEIYATKKVYNYYRKSITKYQLSKKSYNNIVDLLKKNIPELSINTNNINLDKVKISFRGSQKNALIILNEVPISENTFLSLDANSINEITIIKGLAGVTRYGSMANNGVIKLSSKI